MRRQLFHLFIVTSGLLWAAGVRAAEPTFTNVTATVAPGLPGVAFSSVAWGDYDHDGRLDFLLTGLGFSQLWRNTGSGFTNVTASVAPGLPGVWGSSAACGDYDNDGQLDFLLTGSGFSQLWRNTGSGFVNVTATVAPGLPGVDKGSVAWGDYDNDGWLDFLLTGSGFSQLWRNTGSGFVNVTASVAPGLPGVEHSSVAWGDFDNDDRLDFLLTGGVLGPDSNYIPVSQLWRNTATGFVNVTAPVAPGLPGVEHSSVAWGDFDNDDRLDFLITGSAYPNLVAQLWRNTGSGFTNVTDSVAPGLPGVQYSSAAWGDYDNDGRLDFLLTGYSYDGNFRPVSQLWRNTGSGFSNETARVAPGLPGVIWPAVTWGDYDSDGRLDFLLTGRTNASVPGAISQLWRNNTEQTNPPPAVTTRPPAVITRPPASASQTSATLNVSINPHRRATTGWFSWGDSTNYGHATAAQPMGNGNSFTNFSVTITGLSAGVTCYYRAVGSNDQGLVILGFEQHFTLAAPVVTTSPAGNLSMTSATLNGQVNPNNFPTSGWFEWGRDVEDGELTPVQFLASGFGTPFSENLSGLEAGVTYYFRAVAANSLGVTYGAAQSLVTPCPGSLSPPSRSHGYNPKPNYVNFWVGCNWTAVNTNSWITITSATSGTAGSGTLNYTPAVNTDPQPRSGNITIGTTNFLVNQAGGHPIVVKAPTDQTVLVGGTAMFSVTLLGTAPVAIQWQFNHVPLTNGPGISGASTTNLVLTGVQESQAGKYRVLVAGLYSSSGTLTVSCGFTLAASNASFSSLSATGSATLNAVATNCAWSVVNTNPWVTILSSITNIGDGTVVYALAANPTTVGRSGSILIADQTFTITQSGGTITNAPLSLAEALDGGILLWSTIGTQAWFGQTLIAQDGVDAAQSGAIGDSAAVTAQGRFMGPGTLGFWWKVSSETDKDVLKFFVNDVEQTRISGEVDWQSLNYTFPSGTFTSKWTYAKNDSKALGNDRGWLDQVQFDSAAGCPVTLSPGSGFHPTNASDGSFMVTAAAGCAWSVLNTNSWISIASGANGIGNGTVAYVVADNPAATARRGHLHIANRLFVVTQSLCGCAPRLQFMSRTGTQVTLSVQGEPGKMYVLEASQDLNLWRAISTNSAPSTVADAAVGDAPWRFYRTVEIP